MKTWIHRKLGNILFHQKSRYKVVYGGRGSSKSIGMGIGVIKYAIEHPNSKILCVRGTQIRISDSSLQILKDVIYMMGVEDYFDMSEHTLSCHNGSEFLFYGAKAYQQFKSLQGVSLCWVDEAVELSGIAWEFLIPTVRTDESEFWISFNPEKEDDWVYKEFILQDRPDTLVLKLNYWDNPYFPEVLRKEMEWDKKTNYSKYLHIWCGELIKEVEGALWNKDLIIVDKNKGIKYDKIIVAIDPAVTSTGKQDACGIVVAGSVGDNYTILEDASGVMSPEVWASKAVALYHKYEADHITYEANQGGDLVRIVINNIDKTIRCIPVTATRGKILRAEPILLLYEQQRVKHIKHFVDLEYEMVTYTGSKKDKSPNRLDALVWALTDLSRNRIAPSGLVKADISTIYAERKVGIARQIHPR